MNASPQAQLDKTDIWASTDIVKTYLCDHEHYKANGEIDIVVGIR